MSTYHLQQVFRPGTVAVVGGSPRDRSAGRAVVRNLRAAGFPGQIGWVSPRYSEIDGVRTVARLTDLPWVPDLVVITAPARIVPRIVSIAARRGVAAAIILTAGLGRGPGSPAARMEAAARAKGMRILGPHCLGVIAPHARLNASIAAHCPQAGDLALISESSAIAAALVEWGVARSVGFSAVVSLGDTLDVDFGDLLDYFATDYRTRAILLYVERIGDARKFMSAARAAARAKPVVVVKSGRQYRINPNADTHAQALAGSDAVYGAAFARAGLLRVGALDELFAAAETLGRLGSFPGRRLAILSNGGGVGQLAVDQLVLRGGTLAELSLKTLEKLDQSLPEGWSRSNPVDIIVDADGARYAAAIESLLDDPENDALLVVNVPTAFTSSADAAKALTRALDQRNRYQRDKPVFAVWLGQDDAAIAALNAARVPTYATESDAVRGFTHLVRYREAQAALMETPPSLPEDFVVDAGIARAVVDEALTAGRRWLDPVATNRLLAAYGIPIVPLQVAATANEAALLADPLLAVGRTVTLKVLSSEIAHKSDVGGVRLNFSSVAAVREAATGILARARGAHPSAVIPLLADRDGVIALDARVAVAPARKLHKGRGHPRFAIFPYPKEWERQIGLGDGTHALVRPVRPEDDALFRAFFARVTDEDLRLRFFQSVKHFSHEFIARLTQLDYARSIALVAIAPKTGDMLGAVRLHADADYERGEYGILIRSDLKGHGIGWQLMRIMIEYARWLGLKQIEGQVLRENRTMLAMCQSLGFGVRPDPDDATLMAVTLPIMGEPRPA
ncbi:bifunctional acetate--CoA ligase family protein/GNAT family N-acetyltransferase [Xanthomonas oryzae]|nr:bifunctional acetate--CoA ligase family protein/GNAT family N-acetyltransferase [Xanthomonas oryzae]